MEERATASEVCRVETSESKNGSVPVDAFRVAHVWMGVCVSPSCVCTVSRSSRPGVGNL